MKLKEDRDEAMSSLKAELTALKATIERNTKDAPAAQVPAAAIMRDGSQSVIVPYEQRVIARIGNLGWNTEKKTIEERAKQVLNEAGVNSGKYKHLAAVSAKLGSAAELVFNAPEDLQAARFAVKALDKQFEDGRFVWLDAKKEQAELRPSRLMNRAAECIVDVESRREDKMEVQKNSSGKFVKVGGTKFGFACNSQWRWTPEAGTRYGNEVLDMIKDYAEAQ